MGNAHAHLNKLKNGQGFQTEGSRIMQLAEIIRPYVANWLEGTKNAEGLPVQPATVRAISLNAAQTLVKQRV